MSSFFPSRDLSGDKLHGDLEQGGRLRIFVLYAALALLAYAPCLQAPFLNWDDDIYVTRNASITRPSWDGLKQIATKPLVQTYGPVHVLSYLFDRAVWGLQPAGFRLTNVALHAANAYLLFRVLAALGLPFSLAWIAGALWCAHPVHVESVAWISQRKTLLAQLFSLIAILLLRRAGEGGRGRLAFAGSLGAFLLALLSKATAVYVVPLLVLMRWRDGKPFTRRWMTGWTAFLLPALLIGWIAIRTHAPPEAVEKAWPLRGVVTRVSTMLPVAALAYPSATLWPTHLSMLYAPPLNEDPWNRRTAGAVLAAALAVGLTLSAGERRREAAFWLGWYLLALAPVLNIFRNSVILQDRYLYAALGPLLAWFLTIHRSEGAVSVGKKTGLMALGGIVLICLLGLTVQRSRVWASPERLWRQTVSRAPGLMTPHWKLGEVLAARGRVAEAEKEYLAALDVSANPAWEHAPADTEFAIRLRLAGLYEDQARYAEAKRLLEGALARRGAGNRLRGLVHFHLGAIALRQGDRVTALRHYQQAALLDPEHARAIQAYHALRAQ